MTLRNEHRRQLRLIEFGLLGSDPQLVAMMNVFSGLTAGQGMPAWEQTPTTGDRVRETAAALVVTTLRIALTAAGWMLGGLAGMVTAVALPRPPGGHGLSGRRHSRA